MKRLFAPVIALPEPIKAGIVAVVLYLISFLLANLILLLPWLAFLDPFKIQIAIGAAMALIAYIQNVVPDMYENVVIAALQLVLAILAVFGIGTTLAAMQVLPPLISP